MLNKIIFFKSIYCSYDTQINVEVRNKCKTAYDYDHPEFIDLNNIFDDFNRQ